jgi:RimJ/RimL family protein N-acetyltransferase
VEFAPLVLEGRHVRLEPLAPAHFDGLWEIARDPELWRWTQAQIKTREDLDRYLNLALDWQRAGTALPFATCSRADHKPVGSTRFANIDKPNRHAEIGWTWIGKPWQRTAINSEAKLLMLRHAFEVEGCIRVELKTDVLNQQSRTAIRRLGAQEEGIFRHHNITESGRIRDTVYYSVLEAEWPAVKKNLEARLAS